MNKLLVGRYELVEKIGEGGMAVVYKAKDRLLNRYVAVKILRPEFTKDVQFVESFRKESQQAAGLQHPNIISVYDVGRDGDIHFIVMELIDGITLADYIKQKAPMDYREVVSITKQVASALSVAHKNNIVHRDIKPHNIMLTKDGLAKLGDFGIAKAISDATLTDTSTIIGSVHYFSPEQARGSYVDERSDIYSLGIIMYEMLTGQVPFDGDNAVQVALMHINNNVKAPSEIVSGIPPALDKIVLKATDRFQSNRYKNVDLMIEDLNNIEFVSRVMGTDPAANIRGKSDEPLYVKENEPEDVDEAARGSRAAKKADEKKKKRRRKILIAVLCAAAAAVLIFAFVQLSSTSGVKVPDVVGMEYAEAKTTLEAKGFVVKKGDSVTSSTVDEGLVAIQDPSAGERAEKGSTVTLSLSAGKGDGTVPNVVGKDYSDAKEILESAGFKVVKGDDVASSDVEKGKVAEQDPGAGESAENGSTVTLHLSSGAEQVDVPNVVGQDVDTAKATLEADGFVVTTTGQESSKDEGTVLSQNPTGGSKADKGSTITLTYSTGSSEVTVPNLTGLTVSQAQSRLNAANLELGTVNYSESTMYSSGLIISQSPSGGTSALKGSSVDIVVSKGSTSSSSDESSDTTGN